MILHKTESNALTRTVTSSKLTTDVGRSIRGLSFDSVEFNHEDIIALMMLHDRGYIYDYLRHLATKLRPSEADSALRV